MDLFIAKLIERFYSNTINESFKKKKNEKLVMKEKIYKILPHFLQNTLVTLFNVLAYRKRYGGDYKKFRKEKLQNRGLSLTELKAYQAQRYKHLIDFAIKNSAYYQKTLGNIPNASAIENIKHLPIVNKVKFLGLLDIEDVNKYLEK